MWATPSMPMCCWLPERSTAAIKTILKNLYDQMPEPKAVVAIGTCGMSGGMFRDCYNVVAAWTG
jgi:ech hydrogenase subunit C